MATQEACSVLMPEAREVPVARDSVLPTSRLNEVGALALFPEDNAR